MSTSLGHHCRNCNGWAGPLTKNQQFILRARLHPDNEGGGAGGAGIIPVRFAVKARGCHRSLALGAATAIETLVSFGLNAADFRYPSPAIEAPSMACIPGRGLRLPGLSSFRRRARQWCPIPPGAAGYHGLASHRRRLLGWGPKDPAVARYMRLGMALRGSRLRLATRLYIASEPPRPPAAVARSPGSQAGSGLDSA